MNPEHERAGRGCFGKVRYPKEGDAQRMADEAWRKRGHSVRWYRCQLRDGWHLSRRRV